MNSNYTYQDYMDQRGRLMAVALGREPADLVLEGGQIVSVDTGEIYQADVAVKGKRIALVGDIAHCIGEGTKRVDVRGKWLAPGLMDAHMHIESSILTVSELARILLPRGITAIFADPHEVGNVLGIRGLRELWQEAQGIPMHVYICVSSLVPSAPGFETSGYALGPDEVAEMLQWDNVPALGELFGMAGGEEQLEKIYHAIAAGKVVNGHTEMMHGRELGAFIAAGVQDSHNANTPRDMFELLRYGAKVFLMEGSVIKQLDQVVPALIESRISTRHVLLCTDDSAPEDIVKNGHIDRAVRKTIQLGIAPITAIQMATLNCAEHYHLNRDIGSLTPGKLADILVLDDLEAFSIAQVYYGGRLAAENGKMVEDIQKFNYPDWMLNSVRLHKELAAEDFKVSTSNPGPTARVRTMTASVLNKEIAASLPIDNGEILIDIENDILKLAVVERHTASGRIEFGFVHGFGLKRGALASSLSHNHHNIIAVGASDEDMAVAVNRIAEIQGGFVAVIDGEVCAETPLPIAGLLSVKDAFELVSEMETINRVVRDEMEGTLDSPLMVLSFLGLAVVEELHLTDLGLVQGAAEKFVPLELE